MKKEYVKPAMQIVLLQHQTQLLAGSNAVKKFSSPEGFIWADDLDDLDV